MAFVVVTIAIIVVSYFVIKRRTKKIKQDIVREQNSSDSIELKSVNSVHLLKRITNIEIHEKLGGGMLGKFCENSFFFFYFFFNFF